MEEFITQRIGQTIGGRWTLHSVLGVGGMAAVYAASDGAGTHAAVKILHPEIGMRREVRERFMREGTVANRIEHPGAVRVLEHGAVDERSVFLVMERLQGESLGDRVARDGSLPLPDLLDVLEQVLDVLAVAHGAGVVHRDLKPDNLFLTDDGQVKVLDFGVARVLDAAPDDLRTRTGIAMGTLPYMAPEQALGKRAEIDGRVDIFALGATAFRILAKRRVHEADSEAGMLLAMASKPAPALRSVAEYVPENIAAVIDLALAFSRDARYPDARTMQEDVRALQRAERPLFAAARLQARDEATRLTSAERPAVALHAPTSLPAAQPPAAAPLPKLPPPPTIVQATPASTASALTAPASALPPAGALAPVSQPSTPQRASALLLGLGALGCVLLGILIWAVWPGADSTSLETAVDDESEVEAASAMAASPNAERGSPSKASEQAREQQKKMEEFVREQAKKAAEDRRERGKKDKRDKR
jgi:eukaryotic-like serine/threonine-protein kinase